MTDTKDTAEARGVTDTKDTAEATGMTKSSRKNPESIWYRR